MAKDIDISDTQYKYCIGALKALIKDPAFVKQRKTLEEIHKVLEKSNDNWKKWNSKCQKLELEVGANASKIKAAIQLSEEDKSTIDTLKEELEKAWKIADEVKSKTSLRHLIRQSSVQEVGKKSSDKFRSSTNKIDADERKSLQQLDMKSKAIADLKTEKLKLEKDLKKKNASIQEKTKKIEELESNLKNLEELFKNEKAISEDYYKLMSELENKRLHIFEMDEEIARKERNIEELADENEVKTRELQEKEREILALRAERSSQKNSNATRKTHLKASMTNCSTDSHRNELQNLQTQLSYMITKDMVNRAEFKESEERWMKKMSQFTELKRKHKAMRTELREKTAEVKALTAQCESLREELSKSAIAIEELENTRDKNVCSIGQLETKTLELRKELLEFKHCKYPEVIQSLNREFQSLREEMGKERESMNECKKSWEGAIVEKNELKEFVTKTIEQLKVALQSIDFCENQSGSKYPHQAEARIYNAAVAGDENVRDSLSHFKKLIDHLIELCKNLKAENQQLNEEINLSKKTGNSNIDELGIHQPIETYFPDAGSVSETGSVSDHNSPEKKAVPYDDELKDADITTKCEQYGAESFTPEKEEAPLDHDARHTFSSGHGGEPSDIAKRRNQQAVEDGTPRNFKGRIPVPFKHRFSSKSEVLRSYDWMQSENQFKRETNDSKGSDEASVPDELHKEIKSELFTTDVEDSDVDRESDCSEPVGAELDDIVKGDSRKVGEDGTFRGTRSRIVPSSSKPRLASCNSEFFRSAEWKKYGNQLRQKTKKLQLMEAKFEHFNSDFSTRNPIYSKDRPRLKNCSAISVQQLSLEKFRKDLNK